MLPSAAADTLTDLAADGSTIDQTVTLFSADGLVQAHCRRRRRHGRPGDRQGCERLGIPTTTATVERSHRATTSQAARHAFEVLHTREPSDKRGRQT